MRWVTFSSISGGTNVMMSPTRSDCTGTGSLYTSEPIEMVPVMERPVTT